MENNTVEEAMLTLARARQEIEGMAADLNDLSGILSEVPMEDQPKVYVELALDSLGRRIRKANRLLVWAIRMASVTGEAE